jgi:predicted Rossmann fold flavoprotein
MKTSVFSPHAVGQSPYRQGLRYREVSAMMPRISRAPTYRVQSKLMRPSINTHWDNIIIGAGAAGLAAAGACDGTTLILERMKRPGLKLLTTGGGRCNVTHDTDAEGIMAAFGRQGRFMRRALANYTPADIREYLDKEGVPTYVEPDGCVFPVSQQAKDVLAALKRTALAHGAAFQFGSHVKKLLIENGAVVGVATDQTEFRGTRIILATGGRSYPKLGSDGSGFRLAEQAGLKTTPQVPALAGLFVSEPWVGELAGAVLEDSCIWLSSSTAKRTGHCGPTLFTHRGISGPPALALSGEIASELAGGAPSIKISVSVDSSKTREDWIALFSEWREQSGARIVINQLASLLTKRMAKSLCSASGVGDTTCSRLRKDDAQRMAHNLTALQLTVIGTEGWGRAIVTRGGVALSELNPSTLECRNLPGLFCVGEVVDLDGLCGGYNLTWALASGRLAGIT